MKRKRQFRCLMVIAVLILLGVIFYMAAGWTGNSFSSAENVANSPAEETGSEPFLEEGKEKKEKKVKLGEKEYYFDHDIQSFLFVGTDASGRETAPGEEYRGSMADFLLLAVVDRTAHTYAALQLNRDTMTKVTLMQRDGTGMAEAVIQLCTAHWYGGTKVQSCENTVEAVSQMLGGIPINGYYALNMDMIPVLNHAVEGVSVMIQSDFSKVDPTMKQGETIILNDEQAYTFIHDRLNVDDGENISRMERQKQYMQGFMARVQEKNSEQSDFILKMYQDLEQDAVTNITGKTISRLAKQISNGENRGIYTLEGKTKTGESLGDGLLHTEFYVDEDSLEQVMKELYGLKE